MNIAATIPDGRDRAPAWRAKILELKNVFVGELAQHGAWVVANISTSSHWPIAAQKVRWRGTDLWIIPITKSTYPAVAMRVPSWMGRAACEELVMRFVSMLSWVEERGFMVDGIGGGSLPRPMGRNEEQGFAICEEFDLSYFPEVTDDRASLALALMREGCSINHPGYAFLSFYRVLEVAFPAGKQGIIDWISGAIGRLTGFGIKEALDGIRSQGITTAEGTGSHLYQSGRCAIAHANRKPIIDPDKPDDVRRLRSELPIMRSLAVMAIEEELGVETRGTNFHKHLYELDGFKKIIGSDIVDRLLKGVAVAELPTVQLPNVSVRVRRKAHYAPLEGLRCTRMGQHDKLLELHFESPQGDIKFRFALDFGAERIQFDLFRDIEVRDSLSVRSAERIYDATRFWQDLFGNGQLHIVNSHTGELIGRKDAYIPLNMFFDDEGAAAELAYWKTLAEQRRERDRKYGQEMERNAHGYDVTVRQPKSMGKG
jgi:hypothetical protein